MKKRDESKLNLFLHGNSRQVLKEINRIFNVNIQEGTLYWREIAELYAKTKDRFVKIFIERHPQLEREIIEELIKNLDK